LTIGRLRKEIEPVTAADFMRFLFQWQHVMPGARLHGEAGLQEVIRQLAGFEAAASAWERDLLAVRIAKYDPALLDRVCLTGSAMWGRLSPHGRLMACAESRGESDRLRRIVPTSVAPISLFPREDADWLLTCFGEETGEPVARAADSLSVLGAVAQDLSYALRRQGASFFADLVRYTNHLPSEVEDGLWELAAAGLVTADGFDNLRALLDPKRRRAEGRERHRRPRHGAGRWSLLRPGTGSSEAGACPVSGDSPSTRCPGKSNGCREVGQSPVERIARQLLRRYGVVFRDLLGRETLNMAWRDLLMQYRRMEFQGEIRGGRFVDGFTGEQFALPEAVESLRAMRKSAGSTMPSEIRISAADPLNLAGVILPGPRVPAVPTNYLIFRDGVPIRTGTVREPSALTGQTVRLAQSPGRL
jgi:ATP-dependent Lhr-like helicase